MEQDQLLWKTCFHCKSRISTFYDTKEEEEARATLIHRIVALPLLCCHCPSILPLRSKHPASSHSLVSSRLIHLPQCSFPLSALLLLFLPPHRLSFSWFLLYLKIAVHLCNHSIFFHPSPPFFLSVARSAEKNKRKSMCVSHQITTESEERGRAGGDKATCADGDWKEHASVSFSDIRGYTLKESVLKMWGFILSKGGLMQV